MSALLIDITRLLYRHMTGRLPTGIDRVALEYVRHFGDRGRAVLSYGSQAAILPERPSARAFGALLNGAERERLLGAWLMSRATLWDWMFRDGSASVLLNTGHYGLEDEAYAEPLRRRGARLVVFVHDLIPITHPEYCRSGERERHIARTRTALGVASGIIVNSRDTLERLEDFTKHERLACPPVLVAPLASPLPSALQPGPRPLAAPYFVMLATIEPRKNHMLLLKAWPRIAARMGAVAPRLVVIGQRGWRCDDVVQLLDRSRAMVLEQTACSDAQLVTVLHHAQAALLPSFVEGYGIPVVEALTFGVPVLASDLAVFREFAGAVPEYLDPGDEAAWVEAIVDYATPDSARRAAQKARLAGWRAPSWPEHFAAVERFVGELPS